ncbi:MAG TPA: hypothetical protein VN947_32570 [Polyangia bacterium]|nr:hypothetical protein [Polyangia bacterium]
MERSLQPSRGFTLAEAVELFRRLRAANDGAGPMYEPAPSGAGDFAAAAKTAETPSSAA